MALVLLLSASACIVAARAAAPADGSPSDLGVLGLPPSTKPPAVYAFPHPNTTATLADGSWSATVAAGSLAWPHVDPSKTPPARFTVVNSLLSSEEVAALHAVVRDPALEAFDEDADSVDGASTHEFYIEAAGTVESLASVAGKPDADPAVFASRAPHRARLTALLRPIMDHRVVPFVNERIPACGGRRDLDAEGSGSSYEGAAAGGDSAVGNAKGGVGCGVCQALVRRYRDGERLSHATHFDVQALVTVVVSLSRYGPDHTGGLFLTTGSAESGGSGEVFLALQPGDAAVHQSDLLHGVRVLPPDVPAEDGAAAPRAPERWSFIMWLKDGADCRNPQVREWALEGAEKGNAVAAFLQARRSASPAERVAWLRRAAEGGLARAANELGMELLDAAERKRNESAVREGEALLALAAERGEADALFNLGLRALGRNDVEAALNLFRRAAVLGQTEAAFNLGVAAYNGQGGVPKSLDAASAWFEASGVPKGAYLVSKIAASGTETRPADQARAAEWLLRAARSGHPEACLDLASAALERKGGEGWDQAAAVRWLRCAARGGNASAARVLKQLVGGVG
jgi:TPR repeat protein